MRIVFLASGAFALPTLRWLSQSQHDVALVVTQPARPSGRGRRTTPTPVRTLSDESGMETLEVEDVNAAEVIARIQSTDARLGVVIAFGQKLGPELLGAIPGGCINLHASLLPKYRGAAPINWAIVRGEERTGCTVFRVVERMDAGPILATRWTAIEPEENADELHDRLAGIGVDAVDAALEMYEGGALPEGTPQDENEATRAPKLKKPDGFIRFDAPAVGVAHHIRGMTPWPGATARFQAADGRWEKVTITRARRADDTSTPTIPPGTIDRRRYVAARDGFVEIVEIQPSSGRNMTWADYVNGRHVVEGDAFVTP
ncbi:MAG: methionyl-tRNA formyltransferase [Phycisphaerae bacterium]